MIYFNNKKINKIYQDGSLTNKIDMAFEEAEPSRLPEGYTEVEYIENASSAYIDTNIYINTSNFEVGYEVIGGDGVKWGYSHQNAAKGTWLGGDESKKVYYGRWNSSYWVDMSPYLTNDQNTIIYKQNGVTVNGTTISKNLFMGTDSISNIPLYFIAWYDFFKRGLGHGVGKVKSLYIKNNGTLVRDLVPCKRDSDSKYGMYDLVSDAFFVSPNGVNFIGGNPVTPPATIESKNIFRYLKADSPTPPTPTDIKWLATYTGGTTSSADCDSSSAITRNEITKTGLVSVEIGDCVTTIGNYVFQNCSGLTSVELPSELTTINQFAFQGCSGLTSIELPSGLTTIGTSAFIWCTGLSSVTIPNSVTTIEQDAFSRCSGLTSVEIGSGVTTIGRNAFYECRGLTGVTINAITPPALDRNAFDYTNDCPLYCPCESVDAYKAATNWRNYASRIQAIPGSCPPYIQYEYLQGNGTSYILTDYKPNANTSLELDIEGRTVEGISDYESHFFGSCHYDPDNGNAGSKRFKLVYYGTSELRYDYALNQITTSSSAINSRGVIKMNSTGGYLNGTKVVSYTNSLDMSDNQCPIAVFDTAWYNIRNGEVAMQSTLINGKRYRGKIYSVKIYEGDTLVRNYVPAICNGVVGLYETINGIMYGSANSTPFTVGGTPTQQN